MKHYSNRHLFVLAILMVVSAVGPVFSQERPNIVFLMTDDQRWDNFGCYGKPEFKTANIDRLADPGGDF